MFTDNELLVVVYLILYLKNGENQGDLISKLKGIGSKPLTDIDTSSDESFIYDLIDGSMFDLSGGGVCQPVQIDQLLEKVQGIKKQDAFAVIANMSKGKRIKIAKCLEGSFVFEEESYFQDCCKSLNVPMKFRDGKIILPKKKVHCVIDGTSTYCFASRNEAEKCIKILSGLDWNDVRPDVQRIVRHRFQINEQMRPIDCRIWTIADFAEWWRESSQVYHGPAFIAESVDVYCKRVQENAARNRGLLGSTTSSRLRTQQQTGCLVPLVVCMTGVVLSCVVVAIGVAMVSNL